MYNLVKTCKPDISRVTLNNHVLLSVISIRSLLHLLCNESLLHCLSIMMVFSVCMNDYILIYTSACGFDSSRGFLFYLLHYYYYYAGCQYVKKQILISACVVEFTGLH